MCGLFVNVILWKNIVYFKRKIASTKMYVIVTNKWSLHKMYIFFNNLV